MLWIIQFAAFSSLMSGSCSCSSNNATAAAVLQLQLQHSFESIQNVKLPLYTKFSDNKQSTPLVSCLIKLLQLQQQRCSCSSSILLNQFRMSNYPWAPSLMITNELLLQFFNLLPLLASYLEKVLQLQQQQQQWQYFRLRDLDPYPKWGKVREFQKKISSGLVAIREKL